MTQRRVTTLGLGALAVVTSVALSGCSMSWTSMSPDLPGSQGTHSTRGVHAAAATPLVKPSVKPSGTPSASPSASSSAAPSAASAVVPTVPGDLDTGSTTHQVGAGAQTMVIDYWTTQAPATWTPATEATVQLSAHLEGAGNPPKTLVNSFTATGIDAGGHRTVLTQDTGSFVVTRGFTYSGAFVVPASAPTATRTTVTLQWDLLVETYRGSGQFYRQTVLDSLDLALASPATH